MSSVFSNLSLQTKIALLPILFVFLWLVSGINTYIDLEKVSDKMHLSVDVYSPEAEVSIAMIQNLLRRQSIVQAFLRSSAESKVTEYKVLKTTFEQLTSRYQTLSVSAEDQQLFNQVSNFEQQLSVLFLGKIVVKTQAIDEARDRQNQDITPALLQKLSDISDTATLNGMVDVAEPATQMSLSVLKAGVSLQNFLLTNSTTNIDSFTFEIDSAESNYDDLFDLVEGTEMQAWADDAMTLLTEFNSAFQQIVENKQEVEKILIQELTPAYQQINSLLNKLQGNIWQQLNGNANHSLSEVSSINTTNIIVFVVVFVLGTLLSVMIIMGLVSPIRNMLNAMKGIAEGEGDLTVRLADQSEDEVGQLAKQFNLFLKKLHAMVSSINQSVDDVSGASTQVSEAMVDSKSGVEHQNAEIDQVSVAITQMSASFQEVARNTAETADAVDVASTAVDSSCVLVKETIDGINVLAENINQSATKVQALEKQADKVSEILTSIQKITEQINLLALNAAIEAARAGDQGRGFSVVADEVRSLAGSTSKSTEDIRSIVNILQSQAKETTEIILEGNDLAKGCVQQADEVGVALGTISQSVENINGLITQIATASEEQAATSAEINRSIININDVAKTNMDNVVKTSKQGDSLNIYSHSLKDLVSGFKL